MIDQPKSRRPQQFGKRGDVRMPGQPLQQRQEAPAAAPESGEGRIALPRWVIGGVVAVLFLSLVSTGGGSGLFGGLLGGWLAGKMLANRTPVAAPATSGATRVAAPAPGVGSPSTVERGGLGNTTSSRGGWFGGFGG